MIRDATLEDIPRLADIVTACWRHAYRGILPDETLDRDWRAERIERQRKRMLDGWPSFAAEVDGQIVGMMRLANTAPHGYDAEIEGLYVDPAAARTGIGRALVKHGCAYFASFGKRTLYISTMRDNKIGRAFYERIGGRVVVEGTWTFDNVAYPSVGYLWDDLRSLCQTQGV